MTIKEKKLDKFIKNPCSIKFNDIENILLNLGFEKKESKWWSHNRYKHNKLENILIIPVHSWDCKDIYKKITAKIIKNNILN